MSQLPNTTMVAMATMAARFCRMRKRSSAASSARDRLASGTATLNTGGGATGRNDRSRYRAALKDMMFMANRLAALVV